MTVTAWMVDLMPERRGLRLGLGIALVVLGILALGSLPIAGVLSTMLLALALILGGIVALIGIFRSGSLAETLVILILGGMLLLSGLALLVDPVSAQVAITTLLGTYLFLSGMARIVIALFNRRGRWGFAIVHGVVNLLLGILIFAKWPLSGLVAIGLIVAIELIIVGVSWIVGVQRGHDDTPAATHARSSKRRRSSHGSRRR